VRIESDGTTVTGPAGVPEPVAPDPVLAASPAVQAAAASTPAALPQPDAIPVPAAVTPEADPATWAPAEPPAHRCPWCSSVLPEGEDDRCPACGANLIYGSAVGLPGVTELAPASGVGRNGEPPRRNRLLSWISGEVDDEPAPVSSDGAPLEALAMPSKDVRREMLRLRLKQEGMVVSESGDIGPGPGMQAETTPAPAVDALGEHLASAEPPQADSDVESSDSEIRKAS
jgi:hypothetical protein